MRSFLFLVVVLTLFTAACGKAAKPTQDSKTATEAFGIIEAIKEAYLKKESSSIEKNCTREGFRTIKSAIKPFDSAELSFSPTLVEIEGDKVMVHSSWKGRWTRGTKKIEERGAAVFVMRGRPLKVDNVLRTSPFKYPE
ncbi:MAG: hypothetical protein EPN22_15645 [Nitrospirae bacterium]|nr:MAG: hypothetical protein EPN22_15645 [Nitrospirota bacterium]